jgi:UDP-4-amino-4,6-dideoxy-N-acetyl-beta-L-altrosamine N-acetyltransferase
MPFIFFTGGSILEIAIRPIAREDTPRMIAWRNNPRVQQNFIDQKPLDEETHARWLANHVDAGKAAQFIICADGVDVGSVYLRDIDRAHQKAEFGILIGDDAHAGKGVGTKAAMEMIRHGFDALGLNKIFLRVLAGNGAAIHCYEKAGFVREGYFKEDVCIRGRFYDVVFMAVWKKDWKAS